MKHTNLKTLILALLVLGTNGAFAMVEDIEAVFMGRITSEEAAAQDIRKSIVEIESESEMVDEATTYDAQQLLDQIKDAEKLASILSASQIKKPAIAVNKPSRAALPKRGIASVGGSFKMTTSGCPIYANAELQAEVISELPIGKKLWTQAVDKDWIKVFRKKGVGYVSATCLI